MEPLHEIAIALGAARDERAVAEVVVGRAHDALGATSSIAYVTDDDPKVLRQIAIRGVPEDAHGAVETLDLSSARPLAVAIRARAPRYYESRAEIVAANPDLPSTGSPVSAYQAVVALPLQIESHLIGGMAFGFDTPRKFEARDRARFDVIAALAAQALLRARLDRDRDAAAQRLAVLAAASQRFASDLDVSAVLEHLCSELVARIPDTCAVNLIAADGVTLGLAAVHHADPALRASVRSALDAGPLRVGDPSSPGRVAAGAPPVLVPHVPFEQLVANADPAHREHLRRHPIASLMVVPIRYRGRILGTITMTRDAAHPPYGHDDLAFLVELADRAASAIEHARLFNDERAARAAAERAVSIRDDFLVIANHELRTPLSALILQVQAAEKIGEGMPATDPKLMQRLQGAAASALRLARSVDDLLDVSRIAGGGLELAPEPLDLAELARGVAARWTASAEAMGSALTVSAPGPVRGTWDRGRLEQALANLVSNAIKYGNGQPIEVSVRLAGATAELSVRDHGRGIDPADQERIFERFERAVSTQHYGGFGVGLWIARRIAMASGGVLTVSSTPAHGSTFTMALPLATPAAPK